MRPKVRVAADTDGPSIGELAMASGFPIDGLDWSDVAPYWLIAELDGRLVGAIQLCLAKPFGWLEMLFVDPGLGRRDTASVVKALVGRGLIAITAFGGQIAMGTVPHHLAAYKRVLKRRGGVVLSSGNLMAKRLSCGAPRPQE